VAELIAKYHKYGVDLSKNMDQDIKISVKIGKVEKADVN
jgi:hypothetical protein